MITMVYRRLFQMIVVFFIVSLIIFSMLIIVGNPLELMLPPAATLIEIEELRQRLGLDQPYYIQYWRFIKNAIQGDLGKSYYFGQPALRLVLQRLPASLELVVASLLMAVIISVPLGIILAKRRGEISDKAGLAFTLVCISTPTFWLGLVLIFIFAIQLGWLPSSGKGSWKHILMPAFSLSLLRLALFTRLIRSLMLEVFSEDYIRTARAKGLSEQIVIWKHAFKNTLPPFLTIGGIQTGILIAYSIVTERIFAWPGMGLLLLISLERLDYPVVVAYALVTAGIFITLNLIVDILHMVVDPRITYKGYK